MDISLCRQCMSLHRRAEELEDDDYNPCVYCSLNNIGY